MFNFFCNSVIKVAEEIQYLLVEMIDFYMIVYILMCVVIGGYAVSSLYYRQQTKAAIITLVLVILVFTFYGLRWFQGGALKGTKGKKGAWPPIVNMCPDFMATYKHTDGNTYCFDVNNTYNARSATTVSNGFTSLGTVSGVQNAQGYKIRETTGVNAPNATRLKEDIGPVFKWPLLKYFQTDAQGLIGSTTPTGRWLRWEGVWDGRALTPETAPLAP